MPKLANDKHERFCNEFLLDINMVKAYSRTYPDAKPESAQANASRLMANAKVSDRIAELQAARAIRTQTSQDKVVQRLANIAFAELGMVCTWNDKVGLELKDSAELSVDERAIIDNIDFSPISDGDGGLLGYRKKVQLKDSLAALKLLGLHLGMYNGSGEGKKDSDDVKNRFLDAFERVADRLGKRGAKS